MTPKFSTMLCALLGLMVAGLAQGADLRYQGSGDYTNVLAIHGTLGWYDPLVPGSPTTLPGSADTIRLNYGNNTVTLNTVAPNVARFQLGVNEPGTLVIDSGGSLSAIGGSANTVGNNKTGVTGRMNIMTNGVVNSVAVLRVGYGDSSSGAANGILTIDGGTCNVTNHVWVGAYSGSSGTVILTNGGTLNIYASGNFGLGTGNASSASLGTGTLKVSSGGTLNLYNIDATGKSIWPGSVLDISGTGRVTIPGNRIAVFSIYTNASAITANGGTGTVGIDYDTLNPGKTTLTAIGGYVAPTEATWIATSGTGLWSEGANWTGGNRPASVTSVIFDQLATMPCTVNSSASANNILMGTNGPGGTLIVTNGGSLTCGGVSNLTCIGYNSNALLVVEAAATVTISHELSIGLNYDADGTLVMNGGTMSVSGPFNMGLLGGKGTARINGGTLNLSQLEYSSSIQGASVMDISGTGKVVIDGNKVDSVLNYYMAYGLITNSSGTGLTVDYDVVNHGKTTIYPANIYLPPAQVVWTPGNNLEDTNGLWNAATNWTPAMLPGDVTVAIFKTADAIPCTVTNAAVCRYIQMGISGASGGPGGTLIVTNGGSLTTSNDNWSAVGYSSNALMIVENGATVNFGYHLWVGLDPGGDGTFIMNGGTVSVKGMFGLGWQGGKGTFQLNGGTLNLNQWHPTDSIKTNNSVLNLAGTGTVIITGNYVSSISNFVALGRITANGGPNVAYGFDLGANKTTLQVAPARQSVTSVSVTGGTANIIAETTAGHFYHLESSPTLYPATWTRVAGSSTNAAGASVTFSFPASGDQMFYRTVSP